MAKKINWERIVAIAGLIVILAGSAIAWGMLSADVGHLKTTSTKLEKRSEKDGRDIAGMQTAVDAIREDVRDIKSMIQRMHTRGGK